MSLTGSPTTEKPAPVRPPRADAEIRSRLEARAALVRSRMIRLAVGQAAMEAVGALLVVAVVAWGLDWLVELPRGWRIGACMLSGLAALGVLVARGWGPLRCLPSGDALALWIERRRPEFRSRWISAVQLQRQQGQSEGAPEDPATAAFVARLVDETDTLGAQVDWTTVVPSDAFRARARQVGWLAGAILVVGVVAWPTSGILFRRWALEEVALPRQTRIVEITGARTLGRGDDFLLRAQAEGVLPKAGKLVLRHPSGRVQSLPLEADPAHPGRYERTLANLPASFHYRVEIHDATSAEFEVQVLPRPAVTNLALAVTFPEYTRQGTRAVAPSELTLLRGSRLRIAGQATQPLARADIRLAGVERTLAGAVDAADPARFVGEVPITGDGLSGFALELVDQRGVGSRDPAIFAVEVVADRPPQVRMLVPTRREELVTSRSEALVAMEVADDFGLGSLRLMYQFVSATNAVPVAMDLDLTGETNAVVRRRFEWKLAQLRPPLAEGAMVEFWVEATDRNNVDGPGVGRSERYLLRVVSEAEKRADLLGRAGDAIGRLGDVAQGQERLNESLGRIILARPAPTAR